MDMSASENSLSVGNLRSVDTNNISDEKRFF